MMTTLRVELTSSVATLLTTGGLAWKGQVQKWADTFQGSPYRVLDIPRFDFSTLPLQAVVYIGAPDNVMEQHLAGLVRHWSDRTWAVNVRDVRIVPDVAPVVDDAEAMREKSPLQVFDTFGEKAGQVVTILAIGAGVALIIYASTKAKGTQQWQ